MAILQSRQLTKRFGGLVAVNRVSLAVEEGSIFGLVGPNGAGKSVFLNCVAGAQRPDDGRVIFRDQDTTGSPAERLCHLGLSRTFQIPQPFPRMTAIDTVLVAAHFGSPTDGVPPLEQARRSLRFVDFPHPEGTPVSGLNTVELKRLDLCRHDGPLDARRSRGVVDVDHERLGCVHEEPEFAAGLTVAGGAGPPPGES